MRKIFIFCLLALSLLSCKQKDWIDWKTQNEIFMLQNKTKSGVQTTSSGLQYRIITEGNVYDVRPNSTSTVRLDYELSLINGNVIESVNNATLELSTAIKGFVEGIKKIHVHGDIELFIPWDLAYGENGTGSEGGTMYIPPYSALVYTIHLTGVNN